MVNPDRVAGETGVTAGIPNEVAVIVEIGGMDGARVGTDETDRRERKNKIDGLELGD